MTPFELTVFLGLCSGIAWGNADDIALRLCQGRSQAQHREIDVRDDIDPFIDEIIRDSVRRSILPISPHE